MLKTVKWIMMNERERCVWTNPEGLLAFDSLCFEARDDSDKKMRD